MRKLECRCRKRCRKRLTTISISCDPSSCSRESCVDPREQGEREISFISEENTFDLITLVSYFGHVRWVSNFWSEVVSCFFTLWQWRVSKQKYQSCHASLLIYPLVMSQFRACWGVAHPMGVVDLGIPAGQLMLHTLEVFRRDPTGQLGPRV